METILAGRQGFEQLGKQYPPAGHVNFENTSIANVRCAWVKSTVAAGNEVVVYIHGGGFLYGSLKSHAAMVSHIALALKRNILIIDYRLAPEHPFPAGLNDCVSVITTFFTEHPTIRFGIIGDSAGGNLAITAQLKLKEISGPMPRYSIVISPWVDLECKNASYVRNKLTDEILRREYLQWAAGLYAGGGKLSDVLLSPVNADLIGLPPALIVYGTAEILEDDSVKLHQQFLAAGVDAKLIGFEGEQHVWPFMDISSAASQMALFEMAEHIFKNA